MNFCWCSLVLCEHAQGAGKMGSSDAKKLNKMKRDEAKRDDDGAQEVKKGETFGSKNELEFYLYLVYVQINHTQKSSLENISKQWLDKIYKKDFLDTIYKLCPFHFSIDLKSMIRKYKM